MNDRVGYTSISLKSLLPLVDVLTVEIGDENRSATIRRIVKRYIDLKDLGIDILKADESKIEKELKKL
jgi:metal-responsive CopG/Arc/MetJ family transcriptional regulator